MPETLAEKIASACGGRCFGASLEVAGVVLEPISDKILLVYADEGKPCGVELNRAGVDSLIAALTAWRDGRGDNKTEQKQ